SQGLRGPEGGWFLPSSLGLASGSLMRTSTSSILARIQPSSLRVTIGGLSLASLRAARNAEDAASRAETGLALSSGTPPAARRSSLRRRSVESVSGTGRAPSGEREPAGSD